MKGNRSVNDIQEKKQQLNDDNSKKGKQVMVSIASLLIMLVVLEWGYICGWLCTSRNTRIVRGKKKHENIQLIGEKWQNEGKLNKEVKMTTKTSTKTSFEYLHAAEGLI